MRTLIRCDHCERQGIATVVEFLPGTAGAICPRCRKYFPRPAAPAPDPGPPVPIAEQYGAIRDLMKKPPWW